jgi:prepilin-type N-terminal cleavage/methylation domain-containing protein
MANCRRPVRAGLTLIEVLITIALMGILAALVMPNANPAVRDQLVAAAQIVATDLAYGRSLAITSNADCAYTFDLNANSYTLTGTTNLPTAMFDNPGTASKTHTVELSKLPHLGPTVRLYAWGTGSATAVKSASKLVFGSLGSATIQNATTTSVEDAYVWLTAGAGSAQRYIYLQVSGVTGLATVGDFTGTAPAVVSSSSTPVALPVAP